MDPRRESFVRMATLVGNASWLVVLGAFFAVRAGAIPAGAQAAAGVAAFVVVLLLNGPAAMVAVSRASRGIPGAFAVGVSVAIRLVAAAWVAAVLLGLGPTL